MSLFSGLYTGSSGLVTSQNALNTTAHNLANINTAGYTRQQVTQGNRHYDTIGEAYVSPQQVGLGVSYSDVRSVRDYFLDKSYRLENGRSDFYTTNYEVIVEMETLFGEMEGVAFQNSLEELERSVEELQKNPSDATNQGLLVSKSISFLERAQAVYDGLSSYQDNLNERVKGLIEDANSYAEKIYELNDKIKKVESGGIERANDLRDSRDYYLDKLSGLGKISYDEDIHGVVTVQFEGVDFINEDYINKMSYTTDDETGFHTPVWSLYNDQGVFSKREVISSDINSDIGALKALVIARGEKRGTYLDKESALLDEEKLETPRVEGYEKYATPADKYNATTGRSSVVTVMAEFDNLIRGIVTGMNNILEYDDENGNTVRLFEMITKPTGGSLANGTDGWTTSNLMINADLQQTPSKLNDGFLLKDKSVNQMDADALVNIFKNDFDTLNPNTRSKLTFYEYYTAIIGDNATRGQTYKNISDNQTITVSSIDSQRQQVVGVSDNEELTNMIRYQNAYNASSRYINTVNAMLDTLLNSLA
ncbi:MAG: flagellar hook-associated protein FlgK [Lachnospiraceae bacterium]|nr:flagellar hook-associated protein FlgK [Lachnospiraceae bacterium]